MLNNLTLIARVVFSIPVLAILNIIFGTVSLAAAFSVDKGKFPINCDLENPASILMGGYQSLSIIASETAVAMKAAEFGVPDFISTPLLPAFFALVWLLKVIDSDSGFVQTINGLLILLTFSAIFAGFFSKSSFWLDTEKAKLNIWSNLKFLEEVKWDAIRAHESLVLDPNKTSCNIALEMYTATIMGYCQNPQIYECYENIIRNPNIHENVANETKNWIFKNNSVNN